MKIYYRLLILLACLLSLSFTPGRAVAQQTITCESNNGQRQYCGSANLGQVSMRRQLSDAGCVQGQTWGVDNQGLWVDRGCRAEFFVGGWNNGANNGTITCESNDGSRKYCGYVNASQVSMQRQISGTSCVQGQTWGVDNQGLWVDRGCRAVFYTGAGNNGGNWSGNNANGQITCESQNGQRQYCGYAGNNVALQRQLSGSSCTQGQTWGVDNQGLWVDRGCRAVFTNAGYSNNGNWNNGNNWSGANATAVSNYPHVNVDTSGSGTFNSQSFGSNSNIKRAYVDTKNQPTVSLSGSGGFKITFYGIVTQADKRHMTMQINNSDRGPAYGQADIFLNGDKNEVESISLNGNNFNGNFHRK